MESLQDLYFSIGKIFYAIAAADKHVKPTEIEKLQKIIKSDWEQIDTGENKISINGSQLITQEFERLLSQNANAHDCIAEFKTFVKKNPLEFNEKMKKLIMKTANAIADIYGGKNKSELFMLLSLHNALFEEK
jgi:tellurite resistance protein